MSTAIATQTATPDEVMEQVIIQGDLEKLTPEQRVRYYMRVCESVGLNPHTKPFDYIRLNNKLTLYALKGATDQLRRIHGVSARVISQERIDDVLVVTVEATDKAGRVDTEIGAVAVGSLKGDALANAMMKALTKAKRRVTLSICGLGMLDESEVDSIPSAQRTEHIREIPTQPQRVEVIDTETGEIIDHTAAVTDGDVEEWMLGIEDQLLNISTRSDLEAIWAEVKTAGYGRHDRLRAAAHAAGERIANPLGV